MRREMFAENRPRDATAMNVDAEAPGQGVQDVKERREKRNEPLQAPRAVQLPWKSALRTVSLALGGAIHFGGMPTWPTET